MIVDWQDKAVLKIWNMQPYHLTVFAQMTGLSQTQIGRIIKGKRGITANTALRFAQVFSTGAEFWLNIQT